MGELVMTLDKEGRERVLYGFWISPYMALVAHILKESNIPFRYERVSPYVGALRGVRKGLRGDAETRQGRASGDVWT